MPGDKLIERFFRRAGVRRVASAETFWKQFAKRFGAHRAAFLSGLRAERDHQTAEFYAAVYENLDVSLDLQSHRYGFLAATFDWLISKEIIPSGVVVDAACGNGIVTCFAAFLRPHAEIIGFDRSEAAVACARELASRLALSNVRFAVADLDGPLYDSVPSNIDLILGVAAFREAIGEPNHDFSKPIAQISAEYDSTVIIPQLEKLVKRLETVSGAVASVERWPDAWSFVWWAAGLRNAGVSIDLEERSQDLTFKELGDNYKQRVLALYARKDKDSKTPAIDDVLSAWLLNRHATNHGTTRPYLADGELADDLFARLGGKQLVLGARVVFGDGSLGRVELWVAGPLLALFQWSSGGQRVLEVLPSLLRKTAEERVRELAEQRALYTMKPVEYYTEPELVWRDGRLEQ